MKNITQNKTTPLVLAPAGGRESFLAALAAGADAVYCGLKIFSARMAAENFTLEELASLRREAGNKGVATYIAMNTLVKPDEIEKAGKLLDIVNREVKPEAIIIQDLAFAKLAKQVGFKGEIHLSTLADISFPGALKTIEAISSRVSRVVLPRELDIDEIKQMAGACPDKLSLEVFVHGALCYGVSGRCYWSSFLGGRSGLRGRCVQPCRRIYDYKGHGKRYFSCQDLGLDVLAKILLTEPKISAWKIEGRKKGPHYVYHSVKAYKIFRDNHKDPAAKKEALALLARALGRETTHYRFLPQRPQQPMNTKRRTASGTLAGIVKGRTEAPALVPNEALDKGDLLRLGYEDDLGHAIVKVTRPVPKRGRLVLKIRSNKRPKNNTPVFLIDRRTREMEEGINKISNLLTKNKKINIDDSKFKLSMKHKFRPASGQRKQKVCHLYLGGNDSSGESGFWLLPDLGFPALKKIGKSWLWLPPVIWPEDEKAFSGVVKKAHELGARKFVLNMPWQTVFFRDLKGVKIWAGPFCNLANLYSIERAASMGFQGVIVSPELGEKGFLALPKTSPIPLGIVVSGLWPLSISRTIDDSIKPGVAFFSPRGEMAWAAKKGKDFWIYPNWKLDLENHIKRLMDSGYTMFVHMDELMPRGIKLKKREGLWNWKLDLL